MMSWDSYVQDPTTRWQWGRQVAVNQDDHSSCSRGAETNPGFEGGFRSEHTLGHPRPSESLQDFWISGPAEMRFKISSSYAFLPNGQYLKQEKNVFLI